ncbi:LpqE protein [Mycobacterium tuberculosis]|nr:LpqE protein [Mycobacterium tuberculosis]
MTLREETDAVIRNSRRVVVLAVAGAVAFAPVISGCGAGATPQSAYPTRLTEGVNVSVPLNKPTSSQIDLRNMFLLGANPGDSLKPGDALPLYGVMINQVENREDRLVAVSSPAFSGAKIVGGSVTLPGASPDGTGSMVPLLGEPTQESPPPTPPSGQNTGQPTGGPTAPPTAGRGATPNTTSTPTSQNTAGPLGTGAPSTSRPGDQPLVVLTGLTASDLVAGSTVPVRMEFEKAGSVEFQVPIAPHQDDYATYPLATPSQQPAGTPEPGATGPQGSPSPGASGEPAPGASETPGALQSPGGSETPATGN